MNGDLLSRLKEEVEFVRKETLKMVYEAQSGHIGGSLSVVEILVSLYRGGIMRHDPQNPLWKNRDRLIYSKGHASPAYYATLALCGYFPKELLRTFRDFGSPLQGHPTMQTAEYGCPGCDYTSGSLGKGLSFGIGQAFDLKRRGSPARVFVVVSEGDIEEGLTQEALLSCPKDWANTPGVEGVFSDTPTDLDNLFLIADLNGFQNDIEVSKTLPIRDLTAQLRAYGWFAVESAYGNDIKYVYHLISALTSTKITPNPKALIIKTTKGKGVSFMENQGKWHGEAPNDEDFLRAMKELGATDEEIDESTARKKARQDQEKTGRIFVRGKRGTRDAFGDTVTEIMSQDENVYAIAADLANSTRFSKIAKAHPGRFLNVGVQEQNMATIASGLSANDNAVFISTFARFGNLMYEPFLQQAAANNLSVIFLASHAGFSPSKDGKSAETFEHIAVWRTLPNMNVVVPADYHEAKAAIWAAYRSKRPAVIFASRENFPEIYSYCYQGKDFVPGKSIVHYIGKDVTIIACGLMTHFALKAQNLLTTEGIDVGVINMASIKPIDTENLLKAAKMSGALVVAEEHSYIGGLYEAVSGFTAKTNPVPIESVSIDDKFGTSGDLDTLLKEYGLTSEDIIDAVRRVVFRK